MIRFTIVALVVLARSAHGISTFGAPGLSEKLQAHQKMFAHRVLEDAGMGDDSVLEYCESMAATDAGSGINCTCTPFSDGTVKYECADNCIYCDSPVEPQDNDISCGNYTIQANLTNLPYLGATSGYATNFSYDGAAGRSETILFEELNCDENFECAECRVYVNSMMCNSCTYCPGSGGALGNFNVDCENLVADSSFNACQAPPGPGVFQYLVYDIEQCLELPPSPPPFNDNCSDATVVAAGDVVSGSLLGALPENEILPLCPMENGMTLETGTMGAWFTFEGTGEAMLISTCNDDLTNEGVYSESFVSVYQGSGCSVLQCVTSAFQDPYCSGTSPGGTTVTLVTEIGNTYFVYVSDKYGSMGEYDLHLTAFAEPANGQCSAAGEIKVDDGSVFGTAESLPNSGDLVSCGVDSESDGEAWYQFVASEDATLRATTCSSSTVGWGTGITIVEGSCDDQVCVSESIPYAYIQGCGDGGNFVDFEVTAGATYSVAVWGPIIAGIGFYELNVRTLNPPANGFCESAQMIDIGAVVTGSLSADATVSVDELDLTCFLNVAIGEPLGGIWYSFEGTGDIMRAASCSSEINHFITIYNGSCGSLTCVAAASYNNMPTDCSGYGQRSGGVSTEVGVTYYILVSHQEFGVEGSFDISLESFVPAENDECPAATRIFANGITTFATTDRAIDDGFTGNCDYAPRSPGLWYVVVGTGGVLRADTCSVATNFDTVITVHKGICSNLDCVGSNDDGCLNLSSMVIWSSELFVNYYIRVQALGDGVTGDFGLTLSTFVPAENDQCPSAIELTIGGSVDGSFGTATGDVTEIACTSISPDEPTLWYYIDGTGAALDISTCVSNSTVSGMLRVFSGSTDSCSNLSCVPYSSVDPYSSNDNECLYPSSKIRFFAEEGVRYYIIFSAYGFSNDNFNLTVSEFQPVENDVCGGAVLISTATSPIVGSTVNALADEAFCRERTPDEYASSVWYKVIGTGDPMVVSTCSSELNFDSSISVFAGNCQELECRAFDGSNYGLCDLSSFGTARSIFWTEVGTEYFILVSGAYQSAAGDFGLTIGPAETPPNDLCSGSLVVVADNGIIVGSTVNATSYSDFNCTYEETAGVWYSLIGDGGVYAISTCSSKTDFDTAISISGGSCDELECIATGASNDYNCIDAQFTAARVLLRSEVGTGYKIYIHGAYTGAKGTFGLNISSVEVPPNDDCSSAIDVVPNNMTIFGSTVDATDSGVTGCATFGNSPDLWYRVQGNGTILTASLCGTSTTYDSQIAVFEAVGDDCDSVCLNSNDDFCGVGSQIQWLAAVGTTYYIRVYGFGDNSGSFGLTVSEGGQDETSDICETAVEIGLFSDTIGSTEDASPDPLLTWCGEATSVVSNGVWYRIVGDGSVFVASTCNSLTTFDTQVSIFSGECNSDGAAMALLKCVEGNDQFCGDQSLVEWSTIPGVTYYILVHGFLTSTGTFQLSLSSYLEEEGEAAGDNVDSLPAGEQNVDKVDTIQSDGTMP